MFYPTLLRGVLSRLHLAKELFCTHVAARQVGPQVDPLGVGGGRDIVFCVRVSVCRRRNAASLMSTASGWICARSSSVNATSVTRPSRFVKMVCLPSARDW